MKATIREISEITGFSPATVSNALNRKRGVNVATSRMIEQVAVELGYYEEAALKKIIFVIYKENGLITEDTPFFNMMMDGFQKECKRIGQDMVLQYLDRREQDFEQRVTELIQDSSVAVVLVGAELMDQDFHYFSKAKCHFLTLDYWHDSMEYSGILINNESAVGKAIDYLVENGHCEIGYLRGDFRIKAFCARESGYRSAMKKNGLRCRAEYTITVSVTMDGAYQDMVAYLKGKPDLPTAFFADNDMIALGCMKALQEAGIGIPEQISIVGFDDLPFSEISSPRLTSLRVPKQVMGEIAAQWIVEMSNSRHHVIRKLMICPDFIIRDSVRKRI